MELEDDMDEDTKTLLHDIKTAMHTNNVELLLPDRSLEEDDDIPEELLAYWMSVGEPFIDGESYHEQDGEVDCG